MPKEALARARVREIMALISNDIQPVGNLRVLNQMAAHVVGGAEEKAAAKAEWLKHFITFGFEALEQLLQKSAGRYAVGDAVTLADAFLVPQVFNAVRWKVDMEKFPIISRVNAALLALPEVAAAAPSKQVDAEE